MTSPSCVLLVSTCAVAPLTSTVSVTAPTTSLKSALYFWLSTSLVARFVRLCAALQSCIRIPQDHCRTGNGGAAWVNHCTQDSSRDFCTKKLDAKEKQGGKANQSFVRWAAHKAPPGVGEANEFDPELTHTLHRTADEVKKISLKIAKCNNLQVMKRGCQWEGFSQAEKRFRLPPHASSTAGPSAVRLLAIAFISLQVALCLADAQQPASSRSVARSYFASAQKALAAGDSATALEKLNRAVQADPNFAQAYLLLGLTEFQGGQTAKSIRHYKRALKLQPRSYTGHYNLALAYLRERNFQDARAELEQAVSLDARQADAAYDLGIVLLELGDPSAALTQLRRARALKPRPDVDFNIVRAEIETGRVSEAHADAKAAAKVLGSDFQWNAAIGQLFLKNAQLRDAAVYLGKACLIRPDDAEIQSEKPKPPKIIICARARITCLTAFRRQTRNPNKR